MLRRTVLATLASALATPLWAQEKKGRKNRKRRISRREAVPPTQAEAAWIKRLQSDLDARTPKDCGTAFTVLDVDLGTDGGISAKAVVQMDWTPGQRRRPIRAVGASADICYAALLDGTIRTFAVANPACVA